MPYVVTNQLGVDLLAAYDAISATTPEVPGHPHVYGSRLHATDGSEWMFGKVAAGATVNYAEAVTIGRTNDDVTPIVRGTGVLIVGRRFGVYQGATSLTAGMAAWFMLSGAPKLKVGGSCLPNVPLYTTDTSGVLDDLTASTSQFLVRGIVASETNSGATASTVNAIATWPTIAPLLAAQVP
jgi:hypothetical protein